MKRRICIFFAFVCVYITAADAQQTFRGVVTNADGIPLESASIRLLQGSGEQTIGYALTDAQGAFSLVTRRQTDSLQIAASILGYRTHKQSVSAGENLRIVMEQQAFELKEVTVRPGRVWGRQDTINYDVSQFMSPKDESIKDVLQKMPGIDVGETGKISYNGKDISKFYVEGLDLVGGGYNKITNNLEAKAVETVQIMENHQPLRVLKDKIKTEDIALNIKLRAEFRDKWMFYVQGGLGAPPLLWEGGVNAMQLSRHSQSACIYKGNNTGNDVTDEHVMFFDQGTGQLREPDVPSFLKIPSLTASLKKERLLFNNMHTFSADRLYKHLRIHADYIHNERQQERGSQTDYYLQEDTVSIAEQSRTFLRSDNADVSVELEDNADDKFLTNRFNVSGSLNTGNSVFKGENLQLTQHISAPSLGLKNDFKTIRTGSEYTLEARSLVRYNSLPAELTIDQTKQRLPLNILYSDNSFSLLRKRGSITGRYTAGVSGQLSSLPGGFSPYFIPSWQRNRSKWNVSFSMPIIFTVFPDVNFQRMAVNPDFSTQYKLNYAWRFSFSASYRETYGDITDFYAKPYRIDYRRTVRTDGILTVNRQQTCSVYGEYKRTVQEFFATLSLSRFSLKSNRTLEQVFEDGQMTLASRPVHDNSSGTTIRGTLSKGFYDWGMKASISCMINSSRGEQLSGGVRLPFRSQNLHFEPKASWTPVHGFDITWQSAFRYGGAEVGRAELNPLWNTAQKLQLSYEIAGLEYMLSADHYYNDLNREQSVHAVFTDFTMRHRTGRWLLEASAVNLFNRKQYSYTEYSSTQSFTSWINIRGREFLLRAKYKF